MTFWIGLTGGIGSGKSQAAAEFAKHGIPCLDADAVSRSLTAEHGAALPLIRQTFGNSMFDSKGRLNRAALRDTVFRRPEAKTRLENLLQPLILTELQTQQQRHAGAAYGILDIPLLVEKPAFLALADRVLVIAAPEAIRIERVRTRSGLSEPEIRRIMAAQAGDRTRALYADDLIDNSGTPAELAEKIQRLHRFYQAVFSHTA